MENFPNPFAADAEGSSPNAGQFTVEEDGQTTQENDGQSSQENVRQSPTLQRELSSGLLVFS